MADFDINWTKTLIFLASESGFPLSDIERLSMQRFFALYKVCVDAAKKREQEYKKAK